MPMNTSDQSEETKNPKGPSRQVIEELCLLGAVGSGGCTVDELTRRLGLSPLLSEAVEKSAMTLVRQGYLSLTEAQIWQTEAGQAHFGKFA